jgi:hypothetical protein
LLLATSTPSPSIALPTGSQVGTHH